MDIDTSWRVSAERSLDMERKFTLSHPTSIPVSAVYVEKGAITSVVDGGKVNLEDGVFKPSDIQSLGLTRTTAGRTATITAAALCTCPLSHEEVVEGDAPNVNITPIDLSKAVAVRPVLPSFAPLLSLHVFINVRNRVYTRKVPVRRCLQPSRRVRSSLKQ